MNKISILILVFAFHSTCFGQIKNESELTGKWIVGKMINKPTDAKLKPIVDAFEKSTFNFKPNKQFELSTTNETELFKIMMAEVLNGTMWKFDESEQLIKIGNQDNGFSSMHISVMKNNGKPIFHIEESGMTFLLIKLE